MTPDKMIHRLFSANGDGTGASNMNVNGSITPVEFKFTVPANTRYIIHRLCIHISDATTFTPTSYGAAAGPLANGIELGIYDADDTFLHNLFDGHGVTANEDFTGIATKISILDFGAGSVLNMGVHIHFDEQYGRELFLEPGQYMKFIVNDDLTGLTDHHIAASGVEKPTGFGV